ncbi:MvaI/BcnI family restriction endonuclease [Lactobacillus juensis]|uniref:MvaI/BcnI family restriction endonuclease n=1 Tax=Lactobacillus juensis TaxID=3082862 RepID=UPI0030C6D04C
MININDKKFKDLKKKFIFINNLPSEHDFGDGKTWFKQHRGGTTGIGKTFEDLLDKKEDNLQLPDFEGIEIKAHEGSSMITLFTKSPNLPRGATNFLREEYGYTTDSTGIKVLHTSVPSDKLQFNSQSNHFFSITNNRENQTIDLNVYDSSQNLILDKVQAKWSYAALDKAIEKKLKYLAVVITNVKKYEKITFYNYHKIIVTSIDKNVLLRALDDKKLLVDLRLGAYKSGKKKGKNHDHGTGFRITLDNLKKYTSFKTLIEL